MSQGFIRGSKRQTYISVFATYLIAAKSTSPDMTIAFYARSYGTFIEIQIIIITIIIIIIIIIIINFTLVKIYDKIIKPQLR